MPRADGEARVRIFGVGRGGTAAVGRMASTAASRADLVAVGTDLQSVRGQDVGTTVHIGRRRLHGLGAGGDWLAGREAAEESREQLASLVAGVDLVCIAAGLGGGTGTGSSGVLAEVARAAGALTVGVVTRPFRWEGRARGATARAGIARLGERVDALVVVPNDRLAGVVERRTTIDEAFRVADDVVRQAVQAVTGFGLGHLRWALAGAGRASLGIGYATGPDRARAAAAQAATSPLLESPLAGAGAVLLIVAGGDDVSPADVDAAVRVVGSAAPGARVLVATAADHRLAGGVRVTVVAAGTAGRGPDAAPAGVRAPLLPRAGGPGLARPLGAG